MDSFYKVSWLWILFLGIGCLRQTPSVQPSFKMDNNRLETYFETKVKNLEGSKGAWQFVYQGVTMYCFTDEHHDRMRIIAPILEAEKLTQEQLQECMKANFDRALDARYCIYQDRLWSAFIHPLSDLSEALLYSALDQVAALHKNFGSSYSSGALSFNSKKASP